MQNTEIRLPLDYLGRPIKPGDYVFYFSNLYQVLEIPKRILSDGRGACRIVLVDKSATTKPVRKHSSEMCVVPAEDVTAWVLKDRP